SSAKSAIIPKAKRTVASCGPITPSLQALLTDCVGSSWVNQEAVQEFQGQGLMNCRGGSPGSSCVALHHGFYRFPLEVGPGKGPSVKQHLPNVFREHIAVPDTEVAELVGAEKEPFEVEWREEMIDLR